MFVREILLIYPICQLMKLIGEVKVSIFIRELFLKDSMMEDLKLNRLEDIERFVKKMEEIEIVEKVDDISVRFEEVYDICEREMVLVSTWNIFELSSPSTRLTTNPSITASP